MNKKIKTVILFFPLLFLLSGIASAQEHLATLEGVVLVDASPLPGVLITVTHEKSGISYTGVSDKNGHYIIFGINPGLMTVEAKLEGFETKVFKGILLNVGSRKDLNITMKMGQISEVISVTASVPIVDVTKSEVSGVVDRNAIENLPLLNRDFSALTTLTPGAIDGPSGLVSNALGRGTNEMLVDGVSNEEAINNFSKVNVPADAIQEFKVITNQFAAEYGNATGILQSAITRSGTNDIQANVSYYRRDEMFDDVNYFVKHDGYKGEKIEDYEKPDFSIDRISGTLGGPIVKNKAHFFLAYEWPVQKTYGTVTTPYAPRDTFTRKYSSHIFFGKLNYQINSKNLLALRVLFNPIRSINDWGGGGTQTLSTLGNFDSDNIDVNLNWTLYPSNNTVNELRLLYSQAKNSYYSPDYPNSYREVHPSVIYGKNEWYPQTSTDDRYEITENFTIFANKHTIKAGFTYANKPQSAVVDQFNPGRFDFDTDAPFDTNDPTTYPYRFRRMIGDPAFTLDCVMYGIFIQDSWRVTNDLTLNLGIRYNGGSVGGLDIKSFDIKHFNPRLGFSWDPIGDGCTVIRGGWGTFSANLSANAGFFGGVQNNWKVMIIYDPNYPDWQLDNPFWTVPRDDMTVLPTSPYITYYSAQKDALLPYSSQLTLGVQRDLFRNVTASIDLVYTKGIGANRIERTNGIQAGTFDPTIPSRGQRDDMSRGDVMVVTDKGRSEYKALHFAISKRMTNKWALDFTYTLSSSKGDVEAENNFQVHNDDPNWDRQYGYMNYDARHRVTLSGTWQLPLGFQISGIMWYNSKTPWNAIYGYDYNLDGNWGDYVDENRNSRRGFDYFRLDARISKFFNLSEKFQIQVFAEIYNLTNRNNFTNIGSVIDTPIFGIPLGAADPRLVQLGVRLNIL